MAAPALTPPANTNPAEMLPLRDIHLPEPVSWWPPAPGWWLLLAGVLLLLAAFYLVKKIRHSRRLKRAVAESFASIKQQYQHDHNKTRLAQNLSILLRRASISYYPRKNTAGLTGEDWLNFLDNTLPASHDNTPGFNSTVGKILLTAPYLPEDSKLQDKGMDYDADALLSLCQQWLSAQPVKQAATRLASDDTAVSKQPATAEPRS